MQAVAKVPDDAISQLKPERLEDRVQDGVQREYFAPINMVPDLPADRATIIEEANTLPNHLRLAFDVSVQRGPLLIRLADVVGR
jgi:hypothetical protein